MSCLRDFTMPAFWAGLAAFVWYAFGTVPLQIAVAGMLVHGPAAASSWIFVVWFTSGITSIALTLAWRIPIPITWTIPGLIYLGTLAGRFDRFLASQHAPPLGLAAVTGNLAVALAGRAGSATVAWSLPTLAVPEMAFSGPAFIAVACPMVVLALGLGHAQGLGFRLAQGYRVPVRAVTVAVGVNSVLNALLAGLAASAATERPALFAVWRGAVMG